MDRQKFAKDCVITMVADDYENFDLILKWAKRLATLRGFSLTKAQVVDGLKDAINDGYVAVYELSPLQGRQVRYSAGRLHELYYYATAKGKRSAKGIPKLSGGKL
jgi:hypothetical protein